MVARDNKTAPHATSTAEEEEDSTVPTFVENMDYDSAFNTEMCDSENTYTNICDLCNNVKLTTGPTQLEESDMTLMKMAQAIQNLHYCVGLIAPARLQHLVENGQWSWTHVPKPVNFARELTPCSYCALAKAKLTSFSKPITIPNQIGGLFFADVQGPFEVESLEGSVYKKGIIETKTRFTWSSD